MATKYLDSTGTSYLLNRIKYELENKQNKALVGALDNLTTSNKTTIVSAINEVKSSIDSITIETITNAEIDEMFNEPTEEI